MMSTKNTRLSALAVMIIFVSTIAVLLDWPEMRACAAAPETVKRIKLEMAEAEMKGVNATPTFFINGKRAVGPAQFAAEMRKFDAVIAVRRQPPGGKRGE